MGAPLRYRRHRAPHHAGARRRDPDGHALSLALVDPGQKVECEITSIGRVAGTVVAIDAPRASALGVGHEPTDTPQVRRVALGFDERAPEHLKDNLRRAKGKQ